MWNCQPLIEGAQAVKGGQLGGVAASDSALAAGGERGSVVGERRVQRDTSG